MFSDKVDFATLDYMREKLVSVIAEIDLSPFDE
jgi:hypothetical protein